MKLRGAVIVLGAGASKGANLAGKRTPPLDMDFLRTAAAYFKGKKARGPARSGVKAWKKFKAQLKTAGLRFSEVRDWRLEQLSTFLEARASLGGMQLNQGRPRAYAKALESLKVVVCHVLLAEGGARTCELHKMIFDLVRPSAVISFNYDLIADQSLAELGLLEWRQSEYRGATFASTPSSSGRSVYKNVTARRRRPGAPRGVPLLKLHGSMHYGKMTRGGGFRLSGATLPATVGDVFGYTTIPKRPYIIPPIAAKIEIKEAPLRKRWYAALHRLHAAPAWLFWGYSFPVTDTISQVLFRTALLRNRKAKPVVVVNPDFSVASRVVEVCRKVRVEHYSSMERLLVEEGRLVKR